jgi:putative salt-induced outer membrane protein YdiY
MTKRITQLFLLFLVGVSAARTDLVVLENGDRLTGMIVKSDQETLSFDSQYAGVVNLPWSAVTSVESSTPVYVGIEGGPLAVGPVSTVNNQYEIVTESAGTITAAKGAVQFIRSAEEQAAYEREIERLRNPGLTDLWTGFVNLGYAQARGNSETASLNFGANANRLTTRDKIGVTFTSVYASNDTTGESVVTANAIRGGINYNLNLSPKVFVFASTDLEFDEFQNLDLRFAPAGGFGFKVVNTRRTKFDISGGSSLNREFFSTGLNRTSGEGLFAEEFQFQYSSFGSVQQKMTIYPNLSDPGVFRVSFDTTADTRVNRWLSWQVSLSDRYLSNPVDDRKKNDVLLTTGLRITFVPEEQGSQ